MKLFLQVFKSDEAKNQVSIHFDKVREWGVNSFPTVAVQSAAGYSIINRGYCPLDILRLRLDDWLNI
jgi:protein-disulfide isomerase-like protein with CxxC motif